MIMGVLGISDVANLATTVVNKIWPDKTPIEQAEIAAAVTLVQGQLTTNNTEASNQNLFVSGWRPFIGWICGSGLGWNYIGIPLVSSVMTIVGHPVTIPQADISEMMPILIGMLGLGGMRTYEKINGVNSGA
jgi:hypothetical protein